MTSRQPVLSFVQATVATDPADLPPAAKPAPVEFRRGVRNISNEGGE
jgi:hypothetical protein